LNDLLWDLFKVCRNECRCVDSGEEWCQSSFALLVVRSAIVVGVKLGRGLNEGMWNESILQYLAELLAW
jgi:hypothetical protein